MRAIAPRAKPECASPKRPRNARPHYSKALSKHARTLCTITNAPLVFPAPEQAKKPAGAAAPAAPAQAVRKPRAGRFLLMAAVPLALAAGGGWWWVTGGRIQETDNAYLRQARITITAETPGRIATANAFTST